MAYIGKYIDRNPDLRAAGIASCTNNVEHTVDALRSYDIEEAAENIFKFRPKSKIDYNLPHVPPDYLKELLIPELQKSRFVTFREKFSEDMYFKKPELGKVLPLNTKPDNITNFNTTFGKKVEKSDSLYEIVLPRKTPDEVNMEYINAHDKYLISHRHYLPSERINRHYNTKSFNPKATFGRATNIDKWGGAVKRTMDSCNNLIVISAAQKEFLDRSFGRLGTKTHKHNIDFPEDKAFGLVVEMDKCDVKALIEHIEPCTQISVLVEAIAHINHVRQSLFTRRDFHIHYLRSALEDADIGKSGYLRLSQILEISRTLHVRLDETKIRNALLHFHIIEDSGLETERVNYDQFCKLLQIQYPLPQTGNISRTPAKIYNKDTTYRDLCKDHEKPPNLKPIYIKSMYKKNLFETDEPTTAKDVISPDIPMHFGLGPNDFALPRCKEELRRIFSRVLTDNFDTIWDKAKTKLNPRNDLLSVDNLRAEMVLPKKHNP